MVNIRYILANIAIFQYAHTRLLQYYPVNWTGIANQYSDILLWVTLTICKY